MPFVQRVVSPTYLSRSTSRSYHESARGETALPLFVQHLPKAIPSLVTSGKLEIGFINPCESNDSNDGSKCGSQATAGKCTGLLPGSIGGQHLDKRTSRDVAGNDVGNGIPNSIGVQAAFGGGAADDDGDTGSSSSTGKSGSAAAESLPAPLTTSCQAVVSSSVAIAEGHEFESVANITLSNALRQLASLVLSANEVFSELNEELHMIGERSKGIKQRIAALEQGVERCDPKLVPVPESDLETFVSIKNHFKTKHNTFKELFTPETRSINLRTLYDNAAMCPISNLHKLINMTSAEDDSISSEKYQKMRNRIDIEIETRLPASVEQLRKWTSNEALGDITVTPDCVSRIGHSSTVTNNSTFINSNVDACSSILPVEPLVPTQQLQSNDEICSHSHYTGDNSTVIKATQLSNAGSDINQIASEGDDYLPLDHRLPSPEEQCQIIAMKYPAEVVMVDITGHRFQRMHNVRKSMRICGTTNENTDQQLVKRRSRLRKPRGKRRNTIAGTDQREIEEAANGKSLSPVLQSEVINTHKVGRSKSSDLLKRDWSSMLPTLRSVGENDDNGQTKLTRFNSLKQWGRNRLRWMQRNDGKESEKDKDRDRNIANVFDYNDESNVFELAAANNSSRKKQTDKERKLLQERKPSYSSSEKSVSLVLQSVKGNVMNEAGINPVKLRETASLRRQRRNTGLAAKEEPHSSSGNWSASSESGRTSIGSEITVQPKSSASSASLNHSNLHCGSGPPSSIISRRRFLNTSASSSVTSEGTVTPDLQMYDLFYDDETSSAYSCDTEGYYTSFHVDSGLKTLKEEEPIVPLHSTSALSSMTSFNGSGNQNNLTAESEYELFGKGSTSTTTSSAGTVCTTLLATDTERHSLHGPAVPERKSSLTKLNRSTSNVFDETLERSYSSSTVGSTLERTGTIKRNGVLIQKDTGTSLRKENIEKQQKPHEFESPDSGNNTSSSPIDENSNESSTPVVKGNAEFEYSESSDLEGVDRIERIRLKTTINSSRIPSMCIITPTTSDDEAVKEIKMQITENIEESSPEHLALEGVCFNVQSCNSNNNVQSNNNERSYSTVPTTSADCSEYSEIKKDTNFNNFRKTKLQPLNMMLGKLKDVLKKSSPSKEPGDIVGEYATIGDLHNNNDKCTTNHAMYASNDIVRHNLATVLSGNLNQETEYVSLNELPSAIRYSNSLSVNGDVLIPREINKNEQQACNFVSVYEGDCGELNASLGEVSKEMPNIYQVGNSNEKRQDRNERCQAEERKYSNSHIGAPVTFDAQGKIVYNSDSLKRRKGAHTTFAPGPCVRNVTTSRVPVSPSSTTSSKLSPKAVPVMSKIQYRPGFSHTDKSVTHQQDIYVKPTVLQKVSLNEEMISEAGSVRCLRGEPDMDTRDISTSLQQLETALRSRCHYGQQNVEAAAGLKPFQRNNSVYWSLQHKCRPTSTNLVLSKDDNSIATRYTTNPNDLYATPNKSRNLEGLNMTPLHVSTFHWPLTTNNRRPEEVSPINPANATIFTTSTPLKANSPSKGLLVNELHHHHRLHLQGKARSCNNSPSSSGRSTPLRGFKEQLQQPRVRPNGNSEAHDLPKICSDRLGSQKTSLMDFKKLLLAKSSKTLITSKKSAVEQLKLGKNECAVETPAQSHSNLNTSMNILELSGSPKTFANRRILRSGNAASPSKQQRIGWRMGNNRTNVMSTSIPEAHSEEDGSSSNSSNESTKWRGAHIKMKPTEKSVIEDNINLMTNIFLQAEENNFMKCELKQLNSAKRSQGIFLEKKKSNKVPTIPSFNDSNFTVPSSSYPPVMQSVDSRVVDEPDVGVPCGIITTVPSLETAL